MPMHNLQRGIVGSFSVPAAQDLVDAGGKPKPAQPRLVHKASQMPLRLVVRNTSPNGLTVLLAYEQSGLQLDQVATSNAFVLPAGTSETFVLLPDEALYCITPGPVPGTCSYIVNVAFPFEVKA